MRDLIILSHDAYTALRQDLKATGIDLCYSAASSRPLRRRWAPEHVHETRFRQAIETRRPADDSFCIASVAVAKAGNRWWPDQLTVSFHAVGETQEAALQHYLSTHGAGVPEAHRIGVPEPRPTEHTEVAEGHASSLTYIQVALILAVLTTLEVAAFYLPDGMRPPGWMLLIVLLLLSVVKFVLVASYFMHLRYDHRIYAGCFVGGLVVATGTILALVTLFRDPSHLGLATADARSPAQPAVSLPTSPGGAPESVVAAPGNAAAGRQVFEKYACGACHAVTSIPSAKGNIGPVLDGLAQRASQRIAHMSAADYIRQSVMEPGAYVVKGYLKLMPDLRTGMSEREFNDLVAWLQAL
jgi:cytochrome c oxidase subunit IV